MLILAIFILWLWFYGYGMVTIRIGLWLGSGLDLGLHLCQQLLDDGENDREPMVRLVLPQSDYIDLWSETQVV